MTRIDLAEDQGFLVQVNSIQNKSLLDQSGQVAIEFILTFIFALGITFLFVNQAVNVTEGYLVHYANFMASRTFLTFEQGSSSSISNINAAESQAKRVFSGYPLASFGVKARFEVNKPIPAGSVPQIFAGTTAYFEKKISPFSVVGGKSKAKLLSESFLGREPDRITCHEMVCFAITGDRQSCQQNAQNMDAVLYDNGC